MYNLGRSIWYYQEESHPHSDSLLNSEKSTAKIFYTYCNVLVITLCDLGARSSTQWSPQSLDKTKFTFFDNILIFLDNFKNVSPTWVIVWTKMSGPIFILQEPFLHLILYKMYHKIIRLFNKYPFFIIIGQKSLSKFFDLFELKLRV